jgi:hypothetical protein
MADNPRDLIRAAQSAEMQGDIQRAVDCLQKAAQAYLQAGNAPRALQLLRHARRLDGSRVDIAEEVNRLEWMPETLLARPRPEDAEDSRLASELERSLEGEPLPELARRQRLIEDALREAGMHAGDDEAPREHKAWVIETEVVEDLQRLEAQLARVAASVDAAEVARAGGVEVAPVEAVKAAASAVAPVDVPESARPGSRLTTGGEPLSTAPATLLRQEDAPRSAPEHAARGVPGGAESRAEGPGSAPEDGPPDAAPRRRREKLLIDRGPTRADASLDAWCSFCCRPRAEVGDLVAGPAGAFICKGCLSESFSLLGDVTPVPLPARPVEPPGAFMELVGQAEAQALLERALQTGARCLLAIGPEGCGKSVWFQQLQRRGRGVLATLAALEQAPGPQPLLVEDVDRLEAPALAALDTFLARHPRHTVVLSARGLCPDVRGPVLRNDSGVLPVPTTALLAQSVRGAVPVSLLEHVQVLLPLHAPTQADYVEIARRRLALREPAVSLSEDVLGAFAAEAVRSPRAGHELRALLDRVPAGTWSLENATKPAAAPPRKGRRKGGP